MDNKLARFLLTVAALCLIAGGAFAQDPSLSITTSSSSGIMGQDSVDLWVEADNYGPTINVDVHFAIVAPTGAIYEIPSWLTDLTPLFRDLTLPQGFSFGPAVLGNYAVGDFPLNVAGNYLFAAAFAEPWTPRFIGDISFASFTVNEQGASEGSSGGLTVAREKSFDSSFTHEWTTDVSASGVFLETVSTSRISRLPLVEGCEVATTDWGSCTEGMRWLDAGEKIDMQGSPQGNIELQKYAEMGYVLYQPGRELQESDYAGGNTYAFTGYGGPDVGSFDVSVIAPNILDLYQPQLDATPAIDRSQDFGVRWNGAGSGQVYVTISAYDIDMTTMMPKTVTTCSCVFEDDGEAQIPASILGQLPASSGLFGLWMPNFSIGRFNYNYFEADGLSNGGTVAASTSVSGGVELQ
ncbi:MAG TPA: hypothetical protein VM163_10100 [bacterium]|nr:hypothetical protein [bacterium]